MNMDEVAKPLHLKIYSYNLNGIKDFKKSKRIINKFQRLSKSDRSTSTIICLQETHLVDSEIRSFNLKWRFESLHSVSTDSTRGVAVLWLQHQWDGLKATKIDSEGRICSVTLEKGGINYTFTSVYSPNLSSNSAVDFVTLLNQHHNHIKNDFSDTQTYIAGDFNYTTDNRDYVKRSVGVTEQRVRTEMAQLCTDLGLIDTFRVIHHNGGHTWGHKKQRGVRLSRLDRVFAPISRRANIVESIVVPDFDDSDHSLLSTKLTIEDPILRGPGYYKIHPSILHDSNNLDIIKIAIDNAIHSSAHFTDKSLRWDFVKCMIRTECMALQTKLRRNMNELQDAENELNQLILNRPKYDLTSSSPCPHMLGILNNEIERLTNKVGALRATESDRIILNSRAKWAEEGEKSNKYFLNLEAKQKSKTVISKLVFEGQALTDTKQILQHSFEYYKRLYSQDETQQSSEEGSFLTDLPQVMEHDRNELDKAITIDDLILALKTSNDSTPGVDGIPYSLYKCFKSTLMPLLLDSWSHCVTNNTMSEEMRTSLITLIPKPHKDPTNIGNLRPISLTNTDIKLITKALTNKINKVLPYLIHESQSGYIPGRQIHDNLNIIEYAQNVIKQNSASAYLVSLDARKAFDSVNHTYMAKVLESYGFGESFINTVKLLYKNLKASVIINGFRSACFDLEVGVKQGDALSCALFVLCVDPLIRKIYSNPEIEGVKATSLFSHKNIEVKLVAYADDINPILVNIRSIQLLLATYSEFSSMSGIFLNTDKTEILALGRALPNPIQIDNNGSVVVVLSTAVRICGIFFPTDIEESYIHNVSDKISSLKKQLDKWSSRGLSIIGKNILIKTFGVSQLVHSMQTCHVKKTDLKKIEQIVFNFLWRSSCDKVKRKHMYLPKGQGGIGAIDVFSFYKSLKIKRVLRYLNSNFMASVLLESLLFKAGFRSPLVFDVSPKLIRNISHPSIKEGIENLSYLNEKLTLQYHKIPDMTDESQKEYVMLSLANYPIFNSPYMLKLANARDILMRLGRLGIFSIHTLLQFRVSNPGCDPCFCISSTIASLPKTWIKAYSDLLANGYLSRQLTEYNFGIDPDGRIFALTQSNKSYLSYLLIKWSNNLLSLDSLWLRAKHQFLEHHDIYMPKDPFNIPSYLSTYQQATQFKILHNAYTTRARLATYKIITDQESLCSYCLEEYDNLYHGLFKCPGSKASWVQLQNIVYELGLPITLNVGHILFGFSHEIKYHMALNSVALVVKSQLLHASNSRRFHTRDDLVDIIRDQYKLYQRRILISNLQIPDRKLRQDKLNNMWGPFCTFSV